MTFIGQKSARNWISFLEVGMGPRDRGYGVGKNEVGNNVAVVASDVERTCSICCVLSFT